MKCKRGKNFAANQKFNREQDRKIGFHKEVNWFRAFNLMPWWLRLKVGAEKMEKIMNDE